MALEAQRLGAGEILLYSIERDGMRTGFDIETIRDVASSVNIPLIACGGAKNIKDLKKALEAGANAVAAGSIFVYFGDRDAVLINFPEENEFWNEGIFAER